MCSGVTRFFKEGVRLKRKCHYASERSERGGGGGRVWEGGIPDPPPTVWSFFVFQCEIVWSGAHIIEYFNINLDIIFVLSIG